MSGSVIGVDDHSELGDSVSELEEFPDEEDEDTPTEFIAVPIPPTCGYSISY